VRVLSGYRDAVIRFSDNDRTLVPAEVCLDQLLNTPAGTANSSTGPLKIRMSDKQALYVASEEIALGKVVVIDDRFARRLCLRNKPQQLPSHINSAYPKC